MTSTSITSLALLSSGLDSTLALVLAQESSVMAHALTFDYGQKAAAQEIHHAQKLCNAFSIPHRVLKIDFLQQDDHPFFAKNQNSPTIGIENLDNTDLTQKTAKAVWVPNRNGVFLNIAASLAEAQNIDQIVVGFNKEEAQTFPDNSVDYINSLNHCFEFSTQNHVRVLSPTATLNKAQIVQALVERDFDFSLIWSCYRDGTKMCGHCESCQRLKRALATHKQSHWISTLFMK